MATTLRIFEIKFFKEDERVWVAAYTFVHALKVYLKFIDASLVELDEADELTEVPKEEWDTHYVINTDYDKSDPDDWERKSFTKYLEYDGGPGVIAGTAFDQ